jgi:hypothetical protein
MAPGPLAPGEVSTAPGERSAAAEWTIAVPRGDLGPLTEGDLGALIKEPDLFRKAAPIVTLGRRFSLVPTALLAALAGLLLLAASAAAETRSGESSTAINENFPRAEFTLVKADASYESATGSAVFHVTTGALPTPEGKGQILAVLTTSSECTSRKTGNGIARLLLEHPVLAVGDSFSKPGAVGFAGNLILPTELPATKSVSGTTRTLTVASSSYANKEFNCAVIVAGEESEAGGGSEVEEEFPGIFGEHPVASFVSFPIGVPQPSPTPVVTGTPVATPSPPPPLPAKPAALKMAKLETLSVKAGKWVSVKVKVTNTGGTGTGLGSLRVKTAKGVLVKPERQQLPVLAPGASWAMTVRVQVGAKAKPKSTLSLTAAASGVSATGSLVLKEKG